jgi:NTP pyrophosphohydrolases including oxidative damage repair enzymes
MESLTIPGAGAIIEKSIGDKNYILIQIRDKQNVPAEKGLIEIPAGKIRAFENIYDCLRREVKEETGLDVIGIEGEAEASVYERNGYKVLNYTPFSSAQNTCGYYPIMVQIFICKVNGKILLETDETKNIRWVSLDELEIALKNNLDSFYPMHVDTLTKYLNFKNIKYN